MAELSGDFPTLRVRIVGEGIEHRRLQVLARELGIADRVDFLGRRTRQEVAELLQSSEIFALPSRFEGLGVAYLEAMASGLPTIAYRGQGIQEVIRHGENGILVAEQAAEAAPRAWAAVLRTLLKNGEMRQALGAVARHTVEEGYTVGHQAQALLRVYEECRV
jgi:glycosyltransferase involved in cell wall biosynthesis